MNTPTRIRSRQKGTEEAKCIEMTKSWFWTAVSANRAPIASFYYYYYYNNYYYYYYYYYYY